MRTGRAVRAGVAAAAFALLVGCQVPGGSFGGEPLQLRFAELTRRAADAAATADAGRHDRTADAAPIILAGHATE